MAQENDVVLQINQQSVSEDLSKFKAETFDFTKTLVHLAVEYGVRLLGVLLLLIIAWVLAKWARRTLYKLLARPGMDETLVRFAANAARGIILVLAVVGCLGVFGLDTTALAAVLGAAGVAVGLALQGSLSNIAAGILLLALRPFIVGDVIKVAGVEGKVDEIDLFTTKIDSADNRRLIVPNSQIFGSTIENLTKHGTRRVDLIVRTALDAEIGATRSGLLSAANRTPGRLPEPGSEVVLMDMSPGGVTWQVSVWSTTSDSMGVRDALVEIVKSELDARRVGMMVAPGSVYVPQA